MSSTMEEVQQDLVSVVASLLILGRPSSASEVLKKCNRIALQSIRDLYLLCKMKNSPILIQDDELVCFSPFAVKFFSQVISTYSSPSTIPSASPDHVNAFSDVHVHPICPQSNDVACSIQAAQSFSLSRKRNLQNGSESSLDWKYSRKRQKVIQNRHHVLQETAETCNQYEIVCTKDSEHLNSTKDPHTGKMEAKKRRFDADGSSIKTMLVAEQLPVFQKYVAEAKEGSGGYGTVYRALRRSDHKIFAIKCPLEKTCKQFVCNEKEILEKLGGKNFVARLEDVIQESKQDCIVLEYIEHDKPEELKREISLTELQWYGYCLFRALAYLHQEGVIHRDVKPGNFLFSRERNTGFLVDFNLAVDLRKRKSKKALSNSQKNRILSSKFTLGSAENISSVLKSAAWKTQVGAEKWGLPLQSMSETHKQINFPVNVSAPPNQIGNLSLKVDGSSGKVDLEDCMDNLQGTESLQRINLQTISAFNKSMGVILSPQCIPSSMLGVSPTGQGAQNHHGGSALSGDLRKEPFPRTGRRELIDYVAKTVNSPQNNQASSIPVSQRKRVAAPKKQKCQGFNARQECALEYMFHSNAKASHGCNVQEWKLPANNKNTGLQRMRKDGPCVGTKGYRAPEVLLKSLRQSFKADVWSAGVTLLQLATAKSPFPSSGTDQAMVDIVKVRGLDLMVNLAKEHERTCNLSQDLFKLDGARPMSLEEWCSKQSRRSDLKGQLPSSFFDLLEKCLQVNPNKRVTAAEALRHEFFANCRVEFYRKKASIKD